jgi:hypothetical protein
VAVNRSLRGLPIFNATAQGARGRKEKQKQERAADQSITSGGNFKSITVFLLLFFLASSRTSRPCVENATLTLKPLQS